LLRLSIAGWGNALVGMMVHRRRGAVPAATSTSTISYQGRLADSSGNPLTGKYNLEFRIYDVPTGGVPLWTEMWTGTNAVDASDGLFNVMLGSIDNTLASAIEGHDELYLGITVGTDGEMVPRVQLGSVPFSMQALRVPDGAITAEMIADGAVAQAKAPFALIGAGYRMEAGTTRLTADEMGWGHNFLTKRIYFSEPFSDACTPVVVANTDQGWVTWYDRIIAMAGNISRTVHSRSFSGQRWRNYYGSESRVGGIRM
jgi:hypothetical protein